MNTILKTGSFLVLLLSLFACSTPRRNLQTAHFNLSAAIENRDFVFTPRHVSSQRGFSKTLTYPYFLNVSQDTISAYLPYFGRAYRAPINPSEGGITFTSTQFQYQEKPSKKGGWDIKIHPKESQIETDQLRLNISSSGYATLQIISTHRSPISFYGKIGAKE